MTTLTTLTVGGTEVATYEDGDAVGDPTLSPRPFLHPVRTLGGTPVTDCMPDDHRWHLGLSVAVQDVGGVNVWGGRTYVRDQGYVWRDDHGVQRHLGWERRAPDGFDEELGWYGPDGRELLREHRSVHAAPTALGWELGFGFELHNVTGEPLALGSPATNGRTGAGYGGLFWRLSPAASAQVLTTGGTGEGAVHGATTPWVAWTADGVDGPAGQTSFTVVLAHDDPPDADAADPWFIRAEMYPGMCSALAFEQPTLLAPGGSLSRRYRALVADAVLPVPAVASWFGGDR